MISINIYFIYKIKIVLLQGEITVRLAFFFPPAIPLTEKRLTYCFTTWFPTSRTDWKEQKLAKRLKTDFTSLHNSWLLFFQNETENGAYNNENISRPLNTWLLLAYLFAPRNFSHGVYKQVAHLFPFLPIFSSYMYTIRNQIEHSSNKVGRFGNLVNWKVGAWQKFLWIYRNFQYKLLFCFLQYFVVMS